MYSVEVVAGVAFIVAIAIRYYTLNQVVNGTVKEALEKNSARCELIEREMKDLRDTVEVHLRVTEALQNANYSVTVPTVETPPEPVDRPMTPAEMGRKGAARAKKSRSALEEFESMVNALGPEAVTAWALVKGKQKKLQNVKDFAAGRMNVIDMGVRAWRANQDPARQREIDEALEYAREHIQNLLEDEDDA